MKRKREARERREEHRVLPFSETEEPGKDRKKAEKPVHSKRHPGPRASRFPQPSVTADPLRLAFPEKFPVHPGMGLGERVESPGAGLMKEQLERGAGAGESAIYVHIPFCRSRCIFCGFFTGAFSEEKLSDYVRLLKKEIRMKSRMTAARDKPFSALYFGGGTPTDLSAEDLYDLIKQVKNAFGLSRDCEITVEGRTFGLDDEKVSAALEAGANRFSIGVQSFDTSVRRTSGRRLAREDVIKKINMISEKGKSRKAAVVIDLIFGLPGQNMENWRDDIDAAAHLTGIDGLDLYQINPIAGTPFVEKSSFLPPSPGLSEQADFFSEARQTLARHGFKRLSACHWKRTELERNAYNFMNKKGADCLPLGAGAGGRFGVYGFYQDADLKAYRKSIESGSMPGAFAVRSPGFYDVIHSAVAAVDKLELDIKKLERTAGRGLARELEPLLGRWEKAGLVYGRNPVRFSEAGEFWAVNLEHLLVEALTGILYRKKTGAP